jgi:hypothetical protein
MPCASYTDPRLAAVYDHLNPQARKTVSMPLWRERRPAPSWIWAAEPAASPASWQNWDIG